MYDDGLCGIKRQKDSQNRGFTCSGRMEENAEMVFSTSVPASLGGRAPVDDWTLDAAHAANILGGQAGLPFSF